MIWVAITARAAEDARLNLDNISAGMAVVGTMNKNHVSAVYV
jgi:hypothetical protein